MQKKQADIRDVKFRLVGEHANLFIPRARTLLKRAQETVFPAQQGVVIKEQGVTYLLQQYHGQYIVDIHIEAQPSVHEAKEDLYHWFVGIPMAEHVMLDASNDGTWVASGFGITGINNDLLNKEFPQGPYGAYKYAFWRYDRSSGKILCSIKPYKEVVQSRGFDGGRFCISNAKTDPAYGERYYKRGNRIISWHGSHSWLAFNANLVFSYNFPPGWILQQFQRTRRVYQDGRHIHTMPTIPITVIIANNEFNPEFAVAAAAIHKSGKIACVGAIGFLDFPCLMYMEGLPPSPLANQGILITLGDTILYYGDYNIYGIGSTVRFEYESDAELKTAPFLLGVNGINKWATVTITDSGGYRLDIGADYLPFPKLDFNYQALGTSTNYSTHIQTGSSNGTSYLWHTAADATIADIMANLVGGCPLNGTYSTVTTNNPNFFVDGEAGSNVSIDRIDYIGLTNYTLFNLVGTEYTFDDKIVLYKGITDKPGNTSEVIYSIGYKYEFNLFTGGAGSLISEAYTRCKFIEYKAHALPLPSCPSGAYLAYKVGEPPPSEQHLDTQDQYIGPVNTQSLTENLVYKVILSGTEFVYPSDFIYTNTNGAHRDVIKSGHGVPGGCGMGSYTGLASALKDYRVYSRIAITKTGLESNAYGQAATGTIIHPDTGINGFVERIVTITHSYYTFNGAVDTETKTEHDLVVNQTHTNVPSNEITGNVSVNIIYKLYLKGSMIEFYNVTEDFSSSEYTNINTAIDLYVKSSRYVVDKTKPSTYVYTTQFNPFSLPEIETDDREARPWFACIKDETNNTVFTTFYDDYVAGVFQRADLSKNFAGALVSFNRVFDLAGGVKDVGDPIEALEEYTSEEKNPNALWRMEGNYPWVYKLGII